MDLFHGPSKSIKEPLSNERLKSAKKRLLAEIRGSDTEIESDSESKRNKKPVSVLEQLEKELLQSSESDNSSDTESEISESAIKQIEKELDELSSDINEKDVLQIAIDDQTFESPKKKQKKPHTKSPVQTLAASSKKSVEPTLAPLQKKTLSHSPKRTKFVQPHNLHEKQILRNAGKKKLKSTIQVPIHSSLKEQSRSSHASHAHSHTNPQTASHARSHSHAQVASHARSHSNTQTASYARSQSRARASPNSRTSANSGRTKGKPTYAQFNAKKSPLKITRTIVNDCTEPSLASPIINRHNFSSELRIQIPNNQQRSITAVERQIVDSVQREEESKEPNITDGTRIIELKNKNVPQGVYFAIAVDKDKHYTKNALKKITRKLASQN